MNLFTMKKIQVSNFTRSSFGILLLTLLSFTGMAQAPANDDPCAATTLTASSTCTYQTFTNVNSTVSTGFPAPGCAQFAGGDVWFQVTVPAGGALIFDTQVGTIIDAGMAIYSGDCNTMTLIECDDDDSPNGNMPMIYRTGLTPGSTIFIRVWEYNGDFQGTFGICVTTPPPPPANDNCATAVSVPVNATQACTQTVTGTTQSATASTGSPAPTCSATGVNDDVWYSFVATSSTHSVTLSNVTGTSTGMAIALYSGACGSLANLTCVTGNATIATGLTVGQTYYVRVYTATATANLYASFTLCIATPPPPPANDNCSGAVSLTVNPNLACGVVTAGTTVSATASTGVPAPTCGATGVNDDVWYSFTATNATHVLQLLNVAGGTTDMAMSVYSGTGCGALTHMQCSDPETMTVSGLTVGQTYYVRVWTWTATVTTTASFNICVGTPPPPPANDNPCTAIPLTVNTQGICNFEQFTTAWSTSTTGVPAPGCASYNGFDVWFTVTVPAGGTLIFDSQTGVITDGGMAIYSGTCGALTLIECDDDDSNNGLMPRIVRTGLTPGATIWIRFWEFGGDNNGTFSICVRQPAPIPANDNPCNAILLPLDPNGGCNFQTFSNESATTTTGVPAPGCAGFTGGDVWFKVPVPCSGRLRVNTDDIEMVDGGMAFYSGNCGNLTLIECDDDDSENGAMPMIDRTGLTPGDTIWIRMWERNNDNNGSFGICAHMPPPPPPGASCQTAQSFCTSATPTTVPNITGQPNTNGGGIYGCLATIPNPIYYFLQIQTAGNIDITMTQTSTTGAGIDVDFVVWGPFNSLTATCNGISASNIVDCSYSTAAVEIANIPNAQVGQFYMFLVTNFNGAPGTITFQQTGGTGSSNCNLPCNLNATNSGPVCQGATVNLSTTALQNGTYSWTGPFCFTSTQQNPTGVIVPTTPGQYTYTVTATNSFGQQCSDTTIVTVVGRPSLGVDITDTICAGSTFDLTTVYNTTSLTPAWTFNGNPVANPAAVNVGGVYRLIAANTTGCTDTAFVNLRVDTVRSELSVAQIICTRTGRITISTLSGIAPYQYSISSNPGVFQSSNEFIANEGTYTITTRDAIGCTTTNEATITIIPEITVSAGPDRSIVAGESTPIIAIASGGVPSSILWTPSTGLSSTTTLNTVANPMTTTTYTITITNSQGCVAEDDVVVTVIPYCIKVKNAFTPNGDGINETWEVYEQFDCLTNVSVNVFNRYGHVIFSDRNYRNKWVGVYQGKPVPDGTYYAVVEFTLIGGRKFSIKTDLTILR
jgi:gliding motility-associated-like protein